MPPGKMSSSRPQDFSEPGSGAVAKLRMRFVLWIASCSHRVERRGMQLALRSFETFIWVPWSARIYLNDHTQSADADTLAASLQDGTTSQAVVLYRLGKDRRATHKDFVREICPLRALAHDSIQRVFGTCATPGSLPSPREVYLVASAVKGLRLLPYLAANPTANRRSFLSDIASAVSYLHDRGLVHGDLHTDNIIITNNSRAILCVSSRTRPCPPINPTAPPLPAWTLEDRNRPDPDPDAPVVVADPAEFEYSRPWKRYVEETGEVDSVTAHEARKSLYSNSQREDTFTLGILIVEVYTQIPTCSTPTALRVLSMALKRHRPPHPGPVAECRGLDSNTWRICLRCWSIDDGNPCSARDVEGTLRQDRSNAIVCPVYWTEDVVKSWVKARLPFFSETMFPLKTVESYREISFDKMEQTSSITHKGRVVEVMLLHPARSRRIKLHFHHQNFFGEAAVWLQLQHPHILPLFGVVAEMPTSFVIMYPAGGTCLDYLQANASADRLKLARDVADGLQYLHSRVPPVVHGNIRGRSVVVSGSGDALLWNFDFGPLADPVEGFDFSDFVRPIQNRWASPERLMFSQWCPESDVWSFGMFMWEMYSGTPPFPDMTGTRIYETIYYNGLPERPDHEQLDDDVWNIITACWQRQLAARPRISEVLQRIHTVLRRRTGAESADGT